MEKIKKGTILTKEGKNDQKIFLIIEGEVKLNKNISQKDKNRGIEYDTSCCVSIICNFLKFYFIIIFYFLL